MKVQQRPPGPVPCKTWCGCPECSQRPFFIEHLASIGLRARDPQHAKVVGFIHGVPNAQKTVWCWVALARARRMAGIRHNQELRGFSTETGMRNRSHSATTCKVRRGRRFPSWTLSRSLALRLGSPATWPRVHVGPPGLPGFPLRALLKDEHGVPRCTQEARGIEPIRARKLAGTVRSWSGP